MSPVCLCPPPWLFSPVFFFCTSVEIPLVSLWSLDEVCCSRFSSFASRFVTLIVVLVWWNLAESFENRVPSQSSFWVVLTKNIFFLLLNKNCDLWVQPWLQASGQNHNEPISVNLLIGYNCPMFLKHLTTCRFQENSTIDFSWCFCRNEQRDAWQWFYYSGSTFQGGWTSFCTYNTCKYTYEVLQTCPSWEH